MYEDYDIHFPRTTDGRVVPAGTLPDEGMALVLVAIVKQGELKAAAFQIQIPIDELATIDAAWISDHEKAIIDRYLAPLSQADLEKRIANVGAKVTQAIEDFGTTIKTNPSEERLLSQLELLRELIQSLWILLDLARGKFKPPE